MSAHPTHELESARPQSTALTIDDKGEFDHVEVDDIETKKPAAFVVDNYGELSKQHDLSFRATLVQFKRAMVICFGVGICAMGDGYQYKMPGNIVALPGFIRQMGYQNAEGKWMLDPQHVAAWGGVYAASVVCILLVGSYPIDRFGRKPMLIATQVFMLIACLIEMWATNWTHWIAAKVLNGLSVGCNQMTATSYISEIAPTRARGAALGFYQLFWAIGSFAAAIALQVVSELPVGKWRNAIYSMWAFIGLAAIVLIFIPESPRFYCARGNHEKGKKTLQWINGGVSGYDVDHEYLIIQKEIEDGRVMADRQKEVTLLDCFRGTNLRRTIVSLLPFNYQLWIGSPVMFSYTSYFFQQAGQSKPFIATVAVNAVQTSFVAISFFTTEKVGRRPLLVWGGCIMVPLLFVVGGILELPRTTAAGTGMITVACIWVAAYASSAGPLGFVFLAECSTVLLRAKTANMGALANALSGLITTYCTPLMLSSPKFGVANTMFFFGCTGFLCVIALYFIIPETKNRSFVELDEMFALGVPSRQFRTFETSIDRAKKAEAGRATETV